MGLVETERILLEAARLFAGSIELAPTIDRVARLPVPKLADWCLVDLVTDDGQHFERVAVGHQGGAELARALGRRYPLGAGRPGVAAAILTGELQLVPVIDDTMIDRLGVDDEHVAMLRAAGVRSCIAAPMITGGRTIGALTFGTNQRSYGEPDISLVEQLALVAASAIANARLHEADGRAARRMDRLLRTLAALSRASTVAEIAETACRIAVEYMEAKSGGLWVALPDGSLALEGAWGSPKEFIEQFRVLRAGTPNVPALDVLRTGEPIWVESDEDYRRVAPEIFERARAGGRIASWGALPLPVHDRIAGVITFAHGIGHRYETDDRVFYLAVAGHCAQALARAELLDQARHAEERLRLTLEAGAIGTWDYDPVNDVATWDERARRIVGIPDDMPITRDLVFGLTHPDDLEVLKAAVQRAASSDGPGELVVEHRVRGMDGRVRWVSVRGRVQFAGGRPVRLLGAVVDTTEARTLEAERAALLEAERAARAEAEAANRLKDDFLATVSHELRSPLHAIAGWTTRLASRLDDREALARGLELIQRNVDVQTRIIGDILDVSRIVAGKLDLEPRPIDLAAVVRDAIEVVRPALVAKDQALVLHLAERVPMIGDPQRLLQAIGNVLANAVKFTDVGGRISVELSVELGVATVTVRDTGAGIDPEFLPYVFDRFRQADGSSTRRFGGLGLGLAIVQHLVTLHGGRVRAESEGPGRGTTIALELPVGPAAAPAAGTARAGARAAMSPTELAGCRVLLVDDQRDARELMVDVLVEVGAVVRGAASVAEALAAYDELAPDVVLSDISMPGEDGYALIRQIRARAPGRSPYAIALTAFAREEDRARALAAGFDAHVSKPIAVEELVAVIAAGLTQAGARRDR